MILQKILKSPLMPNFDPKCQFSKNTTSNFELIYIYLDTKFIATCHLKAYMKDFVLKTTSTSYQGMVTYEGAAHFFLGPKAENFVISCWDRLNGIPKKKKKKKPVPKIIQKMIHLEPTPIYIWLAHFIPKWRRLIQIHPMNHFVYGWK